MTKVARSKMFVLHGSFNNKKSTLFGLVCFNDCKKLSERFYILLVFFNVFATFLLFVLKRSTLFCFIKNFISQHLSGDICISDFCITTIIDKLVPNKM